MSTDTAVIAFRQPEAIDDPLSDLAREGARQHAGSGADRRSRFLCRQVEGLEGDRRDGAARLVASDIKAHARKVPRGFVPDGAPTGAGRRTP